ncbi:hypothetical protein AKO1_010471 [Acrasis kona]|uniref:Uncharacterized protein n=1 Tax=Acrasis kona TaxID=1008807 RepID=A0AAW2ZIA1_9EUKA
MYIGGSSTHIHIGFYFVNGGTCTEQWIRYSENAIVSLSFVSYKKNGVGAHSSEYVKTYGYSAMKEDLRNLIPSHLGYNFPLVTDQNSNVLKHSTTLQNYVTNLNKEIKNYNKVQEVNLNSKPVQIHVPNHGKPDKRTANAFQLLEVEDINIEEKPKKTNKGGNSSVDTSLKQIKKSRNTSTAKIEPHLEKKKTTNCIGLMCRRMISSVRRCFGCGEGRKQK